MKRDSYLWGQYYLYQRERRRRRRWALVGLTALLIIMLGVAAWLYFPNAEMVESGDVPVLDKEVPLNIEDTPLLGMPAAQEPAPRPQERQFSNDLGEVSLRGASPDAVVRIVEPYEPTHRTSVVAVEGQVESGDIILRKYGAVDTILRCDNFDIDTLACGGWERIAIPFIDTGETIMFSVDHFSSYVGTYLGLNASNTYGLNATFTSNLTHLAIETNPWYQAQGDGNIDLPLFNYTGNTNFTLSLWMRAVGNEIGYHDYIWFENYANGYGGAYFALNLLEGRVTTRYYHDDLDGICDPEIWGPTVNDGEWHHVVVRRNNVSSFSLFIDGEENASVSASPTDCAYKDTKVSAEIGAQVGYSWFNGSLDKFQLYHRPLPDDEISALYALGRGEGLINATALEGRWDFNINSADDTSGNGLHGTFVGNATTSFPTNNLVGYWSFDGDDGSISYDISPFAHHGKYQGAATLVDSNFGKGVLVRGSGDSVNISDASHLDTAVKNITVCAWINMSDWSPTVTTFRTIVMKDTHTSEPFGLVWNYSGNGATNGSAIFLVSEGGDNDRVEGVTTGSEVLGTWTHVCGTYQEDGSPELSIYVNGELESTAGAAASNAADNGELLIGWDGNATMDRYFNGTIDEVMILNTSLDAIQISELYNNQSARFKPESTIYLAHLNTSGGYDFVNVSLNNYSVAGGSYLETNADYWGLSDGYTNDGMTHLSMDDADILNNGSVSVAGVFGYALNFSGGQYVNASFGGNTSMTYAFWWRSPGTGGRAVDVRGYDSGTCAFSGRNLSINVTPAGGNDGTIVIDFSDEQCSISGDSLSATHSGLLDDTWHHIGVSVSDELTIYIDGEQVNTTAVTGTCANENVVSVVGGRLTGMSGTFPCDVVREGDAQGVIDDVIYVPDGYSSQEVARLRVRGVANWQSLGSQNATGANVFNISHSATHIIPRLRMVSDSYQFYTPYIGVSYVEPLEVNASSYPPSLSFVDQTPGPYNVSRGNPAVNISVTEDKRAYAFFDDGLIGWWRFEQGTNDSSSQGSDLTVSGPMPTNDGVYGKGYEYDGDDDWLTGSGVTLSDNMTVSMWVNWSDVGGSYIQLFSRRDGNYGINIRIDAADGDVQVMEGGGGVLSTISNGIAGDKWEHVAVTTTDQGEVFIYVDGGLRANSSGESWTLRNGNPIYFGSYKFASGNIYDFTGKMDDIFIFNRTLAPEEITALYNVTVAGYLNTSVSGSGYKNITAVAVDSAGNMATVSRGWFFDDTAPEASYVNPTPTDVNYHEEDSLVVNISSQDSLTSHTYTYTSSLGIVSCWIDSESDACGDNDGTLTGDANWNLSERGSIGNATLSLDGTDGLMVPSDTDLDFDETKQYTWSAWINNLDATNDYDTIIQKGEIFYTGFAIVLDHDGTGNKLAIVELAGEAIHYSDDQITSGWNHIAVTFDNNAFSFYINGEPSGNGSDSFWINDYEDMQIGRASDYNAFNGSMDEVAFWNRSLSAQDVREIYEESKHNRQHYVVNDWDDSLVGWWRFEEVSGSTVFDTSSRGNDGTLYTAVSTADISSSGHFGKALLSDSSGEAMNIGNYPNTYPFTIALWFNPSGAFCTDNNCPLFEKNMASGFRLRWIPSVENLNVGGAGAWGNCNSAGTVVEGEWHHAVVTINDSGGTHIYLDGGYDSYCGEYAYTLGSDDAFVAGDRVTSGDNYAWRGMVDEVILFNRTLSLAEIESLYNASVNQYQRNFTDLIERLYNFQAYAVDVAGNVNTLDEVSVFVDLYPPTISYVEPTPRHLGGSNESVIVNVSIADALETYAFFDDDLVGWWTFDENNGTYVYDLSPQANHGELVDETYFSTNGTYGTAAAFVNDNDYIDIGDQPGYHMDEFTVSVWVNPNEITDNDMAVFKVGNPNAQGGNSRKFMFQSAFDDMTFYMMNASGNGFSMTMVNYMEVGEWTHYACTFNITKEASCYINGVMSGNHFQVKGPLLKYNHTYIGTAKPTGSTGWNGSIDDILLFNRSLSASEIVALYNASQYSLQRPITNQGYYNLTAHAVDQSSKRSNASRVFTYDTTPPIIELVVPTPTTSINKTWIDINVSSHDGILSSTYDYVGDSRVANCWIDSEIDLCGSMDGTLADDASWAYQARASPGNATLYLDGSGDGMDISDDDQKSFTAWLRPLPSPTDIAPIFRASWKHFIIMDDSYQLFDAPSYYDFGIPVAYGNWTHLALVPYANGTLKLYLDGELVSTLSSGGYYFQFEEFGHNLMGTQRYFKGDMDDIALWDVTLTATEVKEIYEESRHTHQHYIVNDWEDSLFGFWRMDNYAGSTVYDESGRGNDGTRMSGTRIVTDGMFGEAMEFDGTDDDEIEVGTIAGIDISDPTSELTIGVWIEPYSVTGDYEDVMIAGFTDQAGSQIERHNAVLMIEDSVPKFGISNTTEVADADQVAASSFSLGGWHHIVGTLNATHVSIYYNGELDSQTARTRNPRFEQSFYIGAGSNDNFINYQGKMDEIILFNRSLGANEIKSLYNASAYQYINNFTGLQAGQYNATIYAVDAAGNINTTVTSFVINAGTLVVNHTLTSGTYAGGDQIFFNITTTCQGGVCSDVRVFVDPVGGNLLPTLLLITITASLVVGVFIHRRYGQTSTEYMVLAGIVLIIVAVVVAMVIDFGMFAGGNDKKVMDARLKSADVGVVAHVVDNVGIRLELVNNLHERIKVTAVTVDGEVLTGTSLPIVISPGSTHKIASSTITGASGDAYNYPFSINYTIIKTGELTQSPRGLRLIGEPGGAVTFEKGTLDNVTNTRFYLLGPSFNDCGDMSSGDVCQGNATVIVAEPAAAVYDFFAYATANDTSTGYSSVVPISIN